MTHDRFGSISALRRFPPPVRSPPTSGPHRGRGGMSVSVESRMGAVAWAIRQRSVSHPAHQTERADFRHSAFRLASPRDTRGVNQPRAESARWVTLLRPSTQQPRTAPVIDGVVRLIANHLHLAIFESTPEVRALCSAGITRLQRSYDPVRPPPEPPPVATLRPLPSPMTGLPRLLASPSRRAVPTTPADQTGARVDCFPAHAAFPF